MCSLYEIVCIHNMMVATCYLEVAYTLHGTRSTLP